MGHIMRMPLATKCYDVPDLCIIVSMLRLATAKLRDHSGSAASLGFLQQLARLDTNLQNDPLGHCEAYDLCNAYHQDQNHLTIRQAGAGMDSKARKMKLRLVHAGEADIDALINIQFAAFGPGDPVLQALYPGDWASQTVREDAAQKTLERWREDPTTRIIKCEDAETGSILGYAQWNFWEKVRPESEWKTYLKADWCEGRQREIAERFIRGMAEMRWRIWEGKPYICELHRGLCSDFSNWFVLPVCNFTKVGSLDLGLLAVHPDFHRRGVGTMLVKWGLKEAEERGLPAYLEASPAGFPLYSGLGFWQVDSVVVKAEDWDGDHDKEQRCMLWSS
jgi:GNAT superfamily N-acetyltransferase